MCLVMRTLERGVCCLRCGCIVPGFAGRWSVDLGFWGMCGGGRDVVNGF